MTLFASENALLLTLNNGLPPHAEALDCEDVRGPRSLFGESAPMPRPIGRWTLDGLHRAYSDCSVLWACEDFLSPLTRAGRIASGVRVPKDDASEGGGLELEVPAPTYIVGTCDSTFSVAWKLLEAQLLPEWSSVIGSRQTQGRGQLRRAWHSPRGNLYVTFRLPDDPLLRGDSASLITGWLLVRAFRALGFPLFLKWPNDLLLNEQGKAGGVLLEEKGGALLAGLGVNLAEAPSAGAMRADCALPAAVLLPHLAAPCGTTVREPGAERERALPAGSADEDGGWAEEPLAPFVLWRLLVSEVILEYSRSVAGRCLAEVLGAMEETLAWKGRHVVLREGERTVCDGRFLGLGPGGGLVLHSGQGERREVFSGSLFLSS